MSTCVGHSSQTRYRTLLANVKEGKVCKKDAPVKWRFRNCSYISEGATTPEQCPACDHPQAHCELLAENY